MNQNGCEEHGFHLLEVMLTMFVLGLLVGLGWPLSAEIHERVERELFMHLLASDLRYAQSEALCKEAEVTVQLDSKRHLIRLVQAGKILSQTPIPAGYRIQGNVPSTGIVFRETGQVVGGTLYNNSGERVGKLIISVASGRPRVVLD